MLVGVNDKCMYTNFGGHSLSGFVDIAIFKNGKISLSGFRDKISLWSIEVEKFLSIRIGSKNLCFMQVGIDVMCMHTSFGGRGLIFMLDS